MIKWYEGKVREIKRPLGIEEDPVTRLVVEDLHNQIEIDNVQMPLVNGQQVDVPIGSKILFYRTSDSDAKYLCTTSDPTPVGSSIIRQTAIDAALSGELFFEPGEVAMAALGDETRVIPTEGAQFWLKNTGDAFIYSGTMNQRISVMDSSESIDITGSNIDIYASGNIFATHALNFDTTAVTGITSTKWGVRNPTTGVWSTRISNDSVGNISIGVEEPISGGIISGISYTLIPTITTPIVPAIELTAVPLLSKMSINTIEADITSPLISLNSPGAINVGSALPLPPTPLVNVSGINTLIQGTIDVQILAPLVATVAGTSASMSAPTVNLTAATAITLTAPFTTIVGGLTWPLVPGSVLTAGGPGLTFSGPIAGGTGTIIVVNGLIVAIT